MPLEWERIPGGLPEDLWALDGDEIVGRAYQIPIGPERGLWFWTMTALRPGPRITLPTGGTEARRGYSGRRVIEAYERLLSHGSGVPPHRRPCQPAYVHVSQPMVFWQDAFGRCHCPAAQAAPPTYSIV
jgi:hypothetical protein